MRDQVELKYYVGYAGEPQAAFEAACVDAATRLCGGCFVSDGAGYWREGAERRATRFEGPLQTERTLCIVLTTEMAKESDVLVAMRATIARAAADHGLLRAVRWVHVQRHVIVGLHFSIEDALAAAA